MPISYRFGRIFLKVKRHPLRQKWWKEWNDMLTEDSVKLTAEDADRITRKVQKGGGKMRKMNPKRPIPPGSLRGKKAPK
jgi:hypothetical protein